MLKKHTHPPPYRGWRSTKLHLAIITMAAITFGYAMGHFNGEQFGEFVVGVLGAAAIYSGTATVEKFRSPPVEAPPTDGPK
jgi:hypothetical protein